VRWVVHTSCGQILIVHAETPQGARQIAMDQGYAVRLVVDPRMPD
jgi:hypothetical protein